MHEFELGVWKAFFVHLLRIMDVLKLLPEVDCRCREIPTFGQSMIRRFSRNVSELKQLAARDYEDILQCAIPVFEGLLPDEEDNDRLMRVLFLAAHWHGLAKLRMHTDTTINIFRSVTTSLGDAVREFKQTTCSKFETCELPCEANARIRREAAPSQTGPTQGTSMHPMMGPIPRQSARVKKELNLNTYTWHALGDYPSTIVSVGTTDSYTTERV
ncbi:hypothetical protein OF83DRAFT_1018933, partial [Amylostereum chailletii]